MAKKKAAKKAAPAKKAAAKKAKKKVTPIQCPVCNEMFDPNETSKAEKKAPPMRDDEQLELQLDPLEQKALDLVSTSDRLCNDLELAVTAAVAKTVGAVYKKHKINLTPAQAENVALLLFGS